MTNKQNAWFVGSNERKSPLSIYYPQKRDNARILLFLHGFKGFKDWGHFPMIQKRFAESGVIVVAFNFTHNGGTLEDEIDFPDLETFSRNTYEKELEDVGFVLNWIVNHKSTYFKEANISDISILGHSRGGGIALLAAAKYDSIIKVITWAAVADFLERLPNEKELDLWKNNGVFFIKNARTKQNMPMKYDFVQNLINHQDKLSIQKAVCKLNKPLLIIHGAEDETVELENARRINSWMPESNLLVIPNCNHTFNSKHPWIEDSLPHAALVAVDQSVEFIMS